MNTENLATLEEIDDEARFILGVIVAVLAMASLIWWLA